MNIYAQPPETEVNDHGNPVTAAKAQAEVAFLEALATETAALLAHDGIGRTVSIGSSLKVCLVAAGEADAYARIGHRMIARARPSRTKPAGTSDLTRRSGIFSYGQAVRASHRAKATRPGSGLSPRSYSSSPGVSGWGEAIG